MQLRLLGAVLYYLGPTGRQDTVDLGPCLASHKAPRHEISRLWRWSRSDAAWYISIGILYTNHTKRAPSNERPPSALGPVTSVAQHASDLLD